VKLAVRTPVVIAFPGSFGSWEHDATIDDVACVARAADRLGYFHLTCSEHVAIPSAVASQRGARYWDPLATLGYLAACTQRIRLATNVIVLGYHHPVEIAKRYGTLDLVSGGRLVLGVGVGSLREEFDLLGAPFDDRGSRADDSLRALRASLSRREPSFEGEHHHFGDVVVDPCAVQDSVPIWVGGRTLRSLRRAVALADGWTPFGITLDQARGWLDRVELPTGFEVVLGPTGALDPIDAPDRTLSVLGELADLGVTTAQVHLTEDSLDRYLEQLEALAELHGTDPPPDRRDP